jgi:hypothetical protein
MKWPASLPDRSSLTPDLLAQRGQCSASIQRVHAIPQTQTNTGAGNLEVGPNWLGRALAPQEKHADHDLTLPRRSHLMCCKTPSDVRPRREPYHRGGFQSTCVQLL